MLYFSFLAASHCLLRTTYSFVQAFLWNLDNASTPVFPTLACQLFLSFKINFLLLIVQYAKFS